jgi:hypothetical protein
MKPHALYVRSIKGLLFLSQNDINYMVILNLHNSGFYPPDI